VHGVTGQALHENPSIRQAIIRDIEQRDPALAQRLTENPELFDSQIHILPINRSDSQAVQTVCPQFLWLSTGF